MTAWLGLVVIAALHFLNLRFDVPYVTSLSNDAAPEIARLLPAIASEARCQVSRRLLRKAGRETGHDRRSWNRSRARARDLVAENMGQLCTWSAECTAQPPTAR